MSISWGIKQRFKFTANGSLIFWEPPAVSAIYAITYRHNPQKPKSHTILFVGQADDLRREFRDLNRQVTDAWTDSGHDLRELYVFIHHMPGSTSAERYNIQEQLTSEYHPRCNR
jgi:hypothetical protein